MTTVQKWGVPQLFCEVTTLDGITMREKDFANQVESYPGNFISDCVVKTLKI